MDSKELRKQQALAFVGRNNLLLEAHRVDQDGVNLLIDQALNYPAGANRWKAYSVLKKQASLVTGWHATHQLLTSSAHYEVLIDFIDYLLPHVVDTDEIEPSQLYIDDDELDTWFQRAEQVLEERKENRENLLRANNPRLLAYEQDLDKVTDLLLRSSNEEDSNDDSEY